MPSTDGNLQVCSAVTVPDRLSLFFGLPHRAAGEQPSVSFLPVA